MRTRIGSASGVADLMAYGRNGRTEQTDRSETQSAQRRREKNARRSKMAAAFTLPSASIRLFSVLLFAVVLARLRVAVFSGTVSGDVVMLQSLY